MGGSIEPKGGLSSQAYRELKPGEEYQPYIPASEAPAEFTLKSIFFGCLIGVVFGAANAYLGLKVGLTVSASIPAAVMAVAFFRMFRKLTGDGTILETNMVQTIGSAGESLAAGVAFTIPALFIWGMTPSQTEIFLIALFGGFLGILFMIPLRRYLIAQEHGRLPYPEGTACAEVLVASQGDTSKARRLFQGLGIGAAYQLLMHNKFFGLWSKEPTTHLPHFKGAEVGAEITPELLGVGYIIGPKIAAVMLSGGILGWMVLIPLMTFFGDSVGTPIYPETVTLIRDMEPIQIWSRYVRYIGAGGVAFAGIFALIKSLPVIVQSFKAGLANLGGGASDETVPRTERDFSMKFILGGAVAAAVCIGVFLASDLFEGEVVEAIVAGILIVVFSFFFVTVSSRIVGLLGSSSNPVSGMTIATLLVTCLIFMSAGLHELPNAKIAVLIVGAFVCIAAAIAGDTSQDLKTGFLVGATPFNQQKGEFVGLLASALSMGMVMALLKDGIVSGDLPAPQANLMKLVVDGVIGGNLPWALVISGMFIAAFVEMLGISSLAFAVGLYLPMSLSTPIMVGGLIRMYVNSRKKDPDIEEKREAGVLFSSGLIAGAALAGVMVVGLVGLEADKILSIVQRPGIHLDVAAGTTVKLDGKEQTGNLFVSPEEFSEERPTRTWQVEIQPRTGALLISEVTLKAGDKIYLGIAENPDGSLKVATRSQSRNANAFGVFAFLLLAGSLLWVTLAKPAGKKS